MTVGGGEAAMALTEGGMCTLTALVAPQVVERHMVAAAGMETVGADAN